MAHTTANTAQLRRANVWSSQLKDVVHDELMAQGWVNWMTDFPDGDTFNIPSIGELPVRDYVENSAAVYDALDTGNFTFTINQYISSGTYITEKAKQDMYYMSQLVSSFVPKQARAIGEKLETDILALGAAGASGGQTVNVNNAINGVAHRFVANSGAAGTPGPTEFARALASLKKANMPDSNLIAFVDPSVEYVLNTTTNLVNVSNNPMWEGIITSGLASGRRFVKNIYGFDIYTSNYLPAAVSETIDTVAGGANGVCNIFFSAAGKDLLPFMGAWRQAPKVDTEYEMDFQREKYLTTCRYGLKVYRPENLVVMISNSALLA